MTNKEKARERARQVFPCPNEGEQRRITELAYNDACEWKDQQFKEYLEKNRTNYPDFMNGTDAYAFGMKEGYVKAFDRIINELFKED